MGVSDASIGEGNRAKGGAGTQKGETTAVEINHGDRRKRPPRVEIKQFAIVGRVAQLRNTMQLDGMQISRISRDGVRYQ